MIRRRRRPVREIAFSFDSFLDVVANVVGIILRLILVAWIGARSYRVIVPPLPPMPVAQAEPSEAPPEMPIRRFDRERQQITQVATEVQQRQQARENLQEQARRLAEEIAALNVRGEVLDKEKRHLESQARTSEASAGAVHLSLEQLRQKSKVLLAELERQRQLPPLRKTLRYQTPVSAPVQSEEVMFECRKERVTLIDTAALLAQIKRDARERAEQLRQQWQVSDVTPAVGPFRLRYVLERERSTLDGPGAGTPLDGTFRYGLAGWQVEAVTEERGETAEQALAEGSAFRRVVDALDEQQTVVTFWVYPDSFSLYRRLRDQLHRRDIVVAGRPLPEGTPIASSRRGTLSRGQ